MNWDDFDEAKERLDAVMASLKCWYCQKPLGKTEPLLLNGVWECHPLCAPLARDRFGMTISIDDADGQQRS